MYSPLHRTSRFATTLAAAVAVAFMLLFAGGCATNAPTTADRDAPLSTVAERDQFRELFLKALDREALYTLVGGLKPMSTGFWQGTIDIAAADTAEIVRIRRASRRCGTRRITPMCRPSPLRTTASATSKPMSCIARRWRRPSDEGLWRPRAYLHPFTTSVAGIRVWGSETRPLVSVSTSGLQRRNPPVAKTLRKDPPHGSARSGWAAECAVDYREVDGRCDVSRGSRSR